MIPRTVWKWLPHRQLKWVTLFDFITLCLGPYGSDLKG